MLSPDRNEVPAIVRRTLAYAANVDEQEIGDETCLFDLNIDSVTSMTSGVVLQAELGMDIDQAALNRIFSAASVADAIQIVTLLLDDQAGGGGFRPV
jgi:acyl carrier protein